MMGNKGFDYKRDIAHLEGWLTEKEAIYFYHLAKNLPSKARIAEIGSWKGRSTICFGLGLKHGKRGNVYAIDPHSGSSEHLRKYGKVNTYEDFKSNIKLAKVGNFVKSLVTTSESAVTDVAGKVDFVFVDGAHEYRFVKKDYELWFPKLKVNQKIAFHDCWHSMGVHTLTGLLLFTSKEIRNPQLIDTTTIFEKVEKNTIVNRFQNILFFFYRLVFGWIGTVKLDHFGGTVVDR